MEGQNKQLQTWSQTDSHLAAIRWSMLLLQSTVIKRPPMLAPPFSSTVPSSIAGKAEINSPVRFYKPSMCLLFYKK